MSKLSLKLKFYLGDQEILSSLERIFSGRILLSVFGFSWFAFRTFLSVLMVRNIHMSGPAPANSNDAYIYMLERLHVHIPCDAKILLQQISKLAFLDVVSVSQVCLITVASHHRKLRSPAPPSSTEAAKSPSHSEEPPKAAHMRRKFLTIPGISRQYQDRSVHRRISRIPDRLCCPS